MNENNDYNNNNNGGSTNKKRKVGRQRKEEKDVSASKIARTKNAKLTTMYNNAEKKIEDLNASLNAVKEDNNILKKEWEKLKREALASKKQAIRYFESSIKTLKHHYGKSHTRKVLIKELGKIHLEKNENIASDLISAVLSMLGIRSDYLEPLSLKNKWMEIISVIYLMATIAVANYLY